MKINNKGLGKIVIIIALALMLVLAGLGIIVMKGKKHGKHDKPPTSQMQLGEFIVNLADSNQIRYLKTNIVLEVEGEVAAGGGGHGEGGGASSDPRVRDAVIEVLSSKHFAQLVDPKGKDELKKEVIGAVNERLKESGGKAVDVYFNEFAMQ